MVLRPVCKIDYVSSLREMEDKVLPIEFDVCEYEPRGGACLDPFEKKGPAPLPVHRGAGEQMATSRHAAVPCNRGQSAAQQPQRFCDT